MFQLIFHEGLQKMSFLANQGEVIRQILDVEFQLAQEGQSLHYFLLRAYLLHDFGGDVFAHQDIDTVIQSFLLKILGNKWNGFLTDIVYADQILLRLFDQTDLRDVLDAQ